MEIIWPPDTYHAGVAISDDPDNCSMSAFRKMYDFLLDINFPVTRAMWVKPNDEFTGTPSLYVSFYSPLLCDPVCLAFCRTLKQQGFEICLHGASCGNNTRQDMIAALEFVDRTLGCSSCYICHSKNAENLYWDNKTVDAVWLRGIVGLYSRNRCFGDTMNSRYFWGDICKKSIKYIRLFRTTMTNTLKFNPSMPYHVFDKPYVNYWFSATKGYLPRIVSQENIDRLCLENGCSILYQYLHKYVDSALNIDRQVADALRRIATDARIKIMTVSGLLDRLKSMQLVLGLTIRNRSYVLNASQSRIESVQIRCHTDQFEAEQVSHRFDRTTKTAVIESLDAYAVVPIRSTDVFKTRVPVETCNNTGACLIRCGMADIVVNCTASSLNLCRVTPRLARTVQPDIFLPPYSVRVFYHTQEAKELEIVTPIGKKELYGLFWGQIKILLREHLLLGRHLSTQSYFQDPGKMENQATW